MKLGDSYVVKFKRLRIGAVLPNKVTDGSAGYDVQVPNSVRIKYGRQIIPLGWSVSMPKELRMDCRCRSGYTAKGLRVVDRFGREWRIDADVMLGLIDSDYRGEIGAIISTRSLVVLLFGWFFKFRYPQFNSICQLCFTELPKVMLNVVSELDDTDRIGGFGVQNNE